MSGVSKGVISKSKCTSYVLGFMRKYREYRYRVAINEVLNTINDQFCTRLIVHIRSLIHETIQVASIKRFEQNKNRPIRASVAQIDETVYTFAGTEQACSLASEQ